MSCMKKRDLLSFVRKNILWCYLIPIALFFYSIQSCTEDDEGEFSMLEGTWGLVHSIGYKNNKEWNDYFNPFSPSGDNECKINVLNTTDNVYLFTQYYWSNNAKEWRFGYRYTAQLKGNKLIFDQEDITSEITIVSLTSTSLILEEEKKLSYVKYTYRKMGMNNNGGVQK